MIFFFGQLLVKEFVQEVKHGVLMFHSFSPWLPCQQFLPTPLSFKKITVRASVSYLCKQTKKMSLRLQGKVLGEGRGGGLAK